MAFLAVAYFYNFNKKNTENLFALECAQLYGDIAIQTRLRFSPAVDILKLTRKLQSENRYGTSINVVVLEDKGDILAENCTDFSVEELPKEIYSDSQDKIIIKNVGSKKFLFTCKKVMFSDSNLSYFLVFTKKAEFLNYSFFRNCLLIFFTLVLFEIFLFLASKRFIKSIVKPVDEISKMARRIALGDFKTRLVKQEKSEFSELCSTINYMAQKLYESEQMKNDFISSVSHELRTPLTAIKGWAETIILDDPKTKENLEMNKKGMEIIVSESERLCAIVEELLDFSKLQNGRTVLNLEKIDIIAELSEAVYIFVKRAKSENKFLLYSEPETLSPVLGDKNRLKQVFINIIDNALKYTREKGVVNVSAKEVDNFINIEISDNGVGIPKSELPKVKDKFYRGKFSKNGSGIGLALANELVLLHSGRIEIKSEENVGTVVNVYLPKMLKD